MESTHRRWALFVLLVLLVVILTLLVRFVRHRHYYAVTNAVFVETDSMVLVSFDKVNGRLEKLTKSEGERVQKGELLAELDATTYALKVQSLEESLKALQEKAMAVAIEIQRLSKELTLREAQIENEMERWQAEREALRNELAALEVDLFQAERDLKRFGRLWKEKLISKHRFEEIKNQVLRLREKRKALWARIDSLSAAIRSTQKEKEIIKNQRKLVREKEKELLALKAQIKAQEKALSEAQVLLSYCKLKSPVSGYIAKRFHAEGDVVAPGEPVYAVVDFSKLYILVLLEETKLRGVEPGCEAKIKIDAYPGREFYGVVSAVLPATAAKFALVPRDISAGEFTKVAQRVPIKIKITKGDLSLLRVGLGGDVEIKRKF